MSEPGTEGRPNEDACGFAGDTAWVIDGATGMSPAPIIAGDGQTDASWLSRCLNDALTGLASGYGSNLLALLLAAQEIVALEFRAGARGDYSDKADLPCCAVTLVHFGAEGIDCLSLSDTSIIMSGRGGVDGWAGDPLHHQADRDMVERWQAIRKAEGGDFASLRCRVTPLIREQRRRTNQPGAFGVFDPLTDFSGHIVRRRWAAGEFDTVLLMTDGFAALEQDYGIYSRGGLIEAAQAQGLRPLFRALRDFEESDGKAERVPRLKKSDDATALLAGYR